DLGARNRLDHNLTGKLAGRAATAGSIPHRIGKEIGADWIEIGSGQRIYHLAAQTDGRLVCKLQLPAGRIVKPKTEVAAVIIPLAESRVRERPATVPPFGACAAVLAEDHAVVCIRIDGESEDVGRRPADSHDAEVAWHAALRRKAGCLRQESIKIDHLFIR